MNMKEVKSLLIKKIEMIDDPDLLQAVTNLIEGKINEVDLLQADSEDHDIALDEALATIKRDLLKDLPDEKEPSL